MASVKLFAARKDTKKDGTVKTYIQLIHKGDPIYIPLDVFVTSEHFDFKKCVCLSSHPLQHAYNAKLAKKLSEANLALLDLADKDFSPDGLAQHIARFLKSGGKAMSLWETTQEVLIDRGRSNSKIISDRIQYLMKYLGGDMPITFVGSKEIKEYKVYLKALGNTDNTISNYLRTIRIVFTYAELKEFIKKSQNPFAEAIIPADSPGKNRDINIEDVARLESLAPSLTRNQQVVAYTTLLQFYFQGMNLADIITRKDRIIDRYYKFKRFKTRSKPEQPEVAIYVIDKAWAIINHFPGPFLIPVSRSEVTDGSKQYETLRRNFNRTLRAISIKMDLPKEKYLTSTSMRHTWGTIAANIGIPKDLRKVCMNHKMSDSTENYTNRSQSLIDDANRRVTDTSHLNKKSNDKQNRQKPTDRNGRGKASISRKRSKAVA